MEESSRDIKVPEETQYDREEDFFEWSDRWQHILFFFSYIMNFDACLSTLENETEKARSSLVQHNKSICMLVVAILIGGPILFFQTSLGQYTRKSCLFLGEMFPCAYGLGYTMLLISFYKLTIQVFYCGKLFYYFMITLFNRSPPWMKCYWSYHEKFPGCVSNEDIDRCGAQENDNKPCFALANRTLAAFIFKETLTFGRVIVADKDSKFQTFKYNILLEIFLCFINAFVVFICLIAASSKTTKTFYTALRAGMILCAVLLLSILVVVFTQPGVLEGLKDLSESTFHPKIITFPSWLSALRKLVETMRLSEGGHILFGSFLPRNKPDFWRSTILTTAYIVLLVSAAIYYHLFLGQMVLKLHMNIGAFVKSDEENTIFVLFPTSLGILPSSFFFCLIYFTVLYFLCFLSLAVKVIVLEKSITQYFGLARYYTYVRFTICIMACAISISYEKTDIYESLKHTEAIVSTSALTVVTLQLFILNLYGPGRISDDIEYMMRIKVKTFVRVVWVSSPLFFAYAVYYHSQNITFKEYTLAKILIVAVLASPIVIVFILKIFSFAKAKNLVGLIRATEKYGPPDLEERILRVLYNPRLTVRYKRENELCNHECLLNSNAMKIAIKEELSQIMRFIDELKLEAWNINIENNIRAIFRKHVKCVFDSLAKAEHSKEIEDLNLHGL